MDETELDFSSLSLRAGDAVLLASDIQDMGSLSKLTFGNEREPITIDTTMIEADFSGQTLGVIGAQILAAFMSTGLFEAKGALSSANLLGNDIGVEQAQALLKIKEAKPGLTTLCGLSGDETELDLSGKGLGPGCAILLAPEMEANGSLSKLDLSENDLRSDGLSAVSEALKSTSIKHLNIAENEVTSNQDHDDDMSGVIKFAEDMKDMGSLSSLHLGQNNIPEEQMKVRCALRRPGQGTEGRFNHGARSSREIAGGGGSTGPVHLT
jgi:Leucine-rich repeat (LRR) protein